MIIQELLHEIITAAEQNGIETAEAEVVVDNDRSYYKIIKANYNSNENIFHLEVEEAG